MDKINEHIGKICSEYRLKNNLTQNQVAELTGLEPISDTFCVASTTG